MRRVDGADGLPPQHTSDTRSRCGWVEGDIRGSAAFICKHCGLTNLYLRMEGIPHRHRQDLSFHCQPVGWYLPMRRGGAPINS